MFNTYIQNLPACNEIGCCSDAGYQVETKSGAFVTVCSDHATAQGSDTWSSDYNTGKLVTERATATILFNKITPPVFNPNIEVTVF